jgi:hypothetical protein
VKRGIAVAMTAVLGLGASKALINAVSVRADAGPGVGLLAQGGFGDYRNSLAWSMAWFRGKLYVGTGRLVNCVENATVDYYLVVSERYKTKPISGVRCPRNRYDMGLRAEIWQYTPSTRRWRMVYRSPVGRNPRARGKFIARDIAFRGMAVYRDARGRKRLYVGGVTANEFIPELRRRHPPRILSTRDGLRFRATPARNLVGHTPSGYQRPMGFRSMKVWRGRLYVTASATLAGQGAVYEVIRPWSRRARFKQVTPPDLAVFEMEVFNGSLYAGTGNREDGYGVWRITARRRSARSTAHASQQQKPPHRKKEPPPPETQPPPPETQPPPPETQPPPPETPPPPQETQPPPPATQPPSFPSPRPPRSTRSVGRYRVKPIVTGGAGRGATTTSVVSMHVFRHHLYVGSSGWYNNQGIPVSEMIRVDRRGRWQIVAGAPRTVNGVLRGPISGLSDGFYNIFSAHFWRMEDYHGALYVSTNDWSYLVRVAFPELEPWLAGSIQSALAGEYGFDLWATCDGRDWFPVTRNAFGQSNMLDFGGRNLISSPAGLFIGSANHPQGAKLWRSGVGACSSLVGGARKRDARPHRRGMRAASADVAAPQRVLTDAQRAGNVVSWRPSASASRYQVLRAAYLSMPLSLRDPPVLPSGFPPEDQMPDIVPAGSPGARQVNLPVLQAFMPIGTARSTVYVDRTARPGQRYAYRVVALGASGHRSQPSAVQTAPDPRPPPTFKQLARHIEKTTAAGMLATDAWTHVVRHGRRVKLRRLARLRHSIRRDTDAADLVERLERRIRYAGLAGGH